MVPKYVLSKSETKQGSLEEMLELMFLLDLAP